MSSATKATPLTKDETMLFIQLVAANTIVNNKATNAVNNRMKDDAWKTITNNFNSSIISFPRTPAQLRLKWENLKKSARKRCANMRSSYNKTGGSQDYIRADEILDKVASLLGSTCQGFSVEFGGDATIQADKTKLLDEVNVEGSVIRDKRGDGVRSRGVNEGEVLEERHSSSTPATKQKKKNYGRASGSGTLAKRKYKMEEEMCKARISRDNAMTEYLIAKKKKIDLENEEKEINIAKLKLELQNARLENLKLRTSLN